MSEENAFNSRRQQFLLSEESAKEEKGLCQRIISDKWPMKMESQNRICVACVCLGVATAQTDGHSSERNLEFLKVV